MVLDLYLMFKTVDFGINHSWYFEWFMNRKISSNIGIIQHNFQWRREVGSHSAPKQSRCESIENWQQSGSTRNRAVFVKASFHGILQGGAPVRERVQLVYVSTISLGLMNGGYIELVIGIINQLITGVAPPCGWQGFHCWIMLDYCPKNISA